jgi:hypothetical protein
MKFLLILSCFFLTSCITENPTVLENKPVGYTLLNDPANTYPYEGLRIIRYYKIIQTASKLDMKVPSSYRLSYYFDIYINNEKIFMGYETDLTNSVNEAIAKKIFPDFKEVDLSFYGLRVGDQFHKEKIKEIDREVKPNNLTRINIEPQKPWESALIEIDSDGIIKQLIFTKKFNDPKSEYSFFEKIKNELAMKIHPIDTYSNILYFRSKMNNLDEHNDQRLISYEGVVSKNDIMIRAKNTIPAYLHEYKPKPIMYQFNYFQNPTVGKVGLVDNEEEMVVNLNIQSNDYLFLGLK